MKRKLRGDVAGEAPKTTASENLRGVSHKFPAADVQLGFTEADEVISNARERRV